MLTYSKMHTSAIKIDKWTFTKQRNGFSLTLNE